MTSLHPLRLIILAGVAVCAVPWNNVPLRRAMVKGMTPIYEYINHSEYRFGYCEDESRLLYMKRSMIHSKNTYMRRLLTAVVSTGYINLSSFLRHLSEAGSPASEECHDQYFFRLFSKSDYNPSNVDVTETQINEITVYEKVEFIPNCTVILMKSPPSQYALSQRLPMQLCYSRITFMAHYFINITMMLDLTFFNELAIPMEIHLFYYRFKRFNG